MPQNDAPPAPDRNTDIPAWVTPQLLADTRQVWQRFYDKTLTDADVLAILLRVGQLFDVLGTTNDEQQQQRQAVSGIGAGVEP